MDTPASKRSVPRRIGEVALKVLGLFVILEPIWMLLPFAGFLYGSVLHIPALNQRPRTAWLTHFVFPVLTGGWLGPVMILVGFALFCVGAGQIYWAKIRRSGLVTGGMYRFVRHPQYVALTLFGVGILLTWGRAITFLAFFLMMFLYYYLAKSEERTCVRLFGKHYEQYRRGTSFILPGDRMLRPLAAKLPSLPLPAPLRVAGALAIMLVVCFALMGLIQAIKAGVRTVPYLTAEVALGKVSKAATQMTVTAKQAGGIPYVQSGRIAVVRGPYRNAWAPGFAERVLQRLRGSKTLAPFLTFLDEPGADVLIVWCGPYDKPAAPGGPGMHRGGGAGGRGPAPDPHGPDRVRLILMRCSPAAGATIADALADTSKRKIAGGCVAQVNVGKAEDEDFVEADGRIRGRGFPGEDRWAFYLKQLSQRAAATPGPAAVPGTHEKATLVMVKAPILRTRLDPPFAKEMLDRLAASASFRRRMRSTGAGGDVVTVAFPRPGPNWYRAHHGTPQISLFVMTARLREGAGVGDLFRSGRRKLLGAFIAEMDFAIAPPADCVGTITTIGPWRDLEERWRFFVSGVGNEGGAVRDAAAKRGGLHRLWD